MTLTAPNTSLTWQKIKYINKLLNIALDRHQATFSAYFRQWVRLVDDPPEATNNSAGTRQQLQGLLKILYRPESARCPSLSSDQQRRNTD